MNQIVFTGEENKKLIKVESIIKFFAIAIIVLGITIAGGAEYTKIKINEQVTANAEPQVQFTSSELDAIVKIDVTHIRGIQAIEYAWNDEKSVVLKENNKKRVSETINLIGGTNILTVKITEENGKTVTYEKTYTAGKIPRIELQAVPDGVKIIATSDDQIDYISYSWDDGEINKIQVNEKNYEGVIQAPNGLHTLDIVVYDKNGNKASKNQQVVGDTAPTLKISIPENSKKYLLNAEDDEKLSKIEITYDDGKKETIEINAATFEKEIELTSGENKLMVVVYNLNGLTTTKKVKCPIS